MKTYNVTLEVRTQKALKPEQQERLREFVLKDLVSLAYRVLCRIRRKLYGEA